MNDIPAFTEAGGVSTLILREVPYKKAAFVMVRLWEEGRLEAHLQQAAMLCRIAGAKEIFAAAQDRRLFPQRQPEYEMFHLTANCRKFEAPEPEGEDLSDSNMEAYINIYNACFDAALSAQTFTENAARKAMTQPQRRCRLYRIDGVLAAVTDVTIDESCTLNAIGVLPKFRGGLGEKLLKRVMTTAAEKGCKKLCVDVMSTNAPALKLYAKFGFEPEDTPISWYKIS